MSSDSVQDSTRVVVSGVRHGSILPGNRAEMWRDVYLLPGADLRGGAWGNRILVQGPGVKVSGAVYARGSITVAAGKPPTAGEPVTFESTVTTPDSFQIGEAPFRTRILSNVYCGSIRLQNSIVFGNVYARAGVIRDSVVLGGVFCHESVSIENSVIATARARRVTFGKGVSLLFPVAFAQEDMDVRDTVRALTFFRLPSAAAATASTGGAIDLGATDVLKVQERVEGGEPRDLLVLTANQRIVDIQPMVDAFRCNRRLLELLANAAHLEPGRKDELIGALGRDIEDRMMALIGRAGLPAVSASTPIEEIRKRLDVSEVLRQEAGSTVISPGASSGLSRALPGRLVTEAGRALVNQLLSLA